MTSTCPYRESLACRPPTSAPGIANRPDPITTPDAISPKPGRSSHAPLRMCSRRSYLLATGSNGGAQLGIGHTQDVGSFSRCRFATKAGLESAETRTSVDCDNVIHGPAQTGAGSHVDGGVSTSIEEYYDPLAYPGSSILNLTSGASHSLLLLGTSLLPGVGTTQLYICGTSSHGQLGPSVKRGPMGIAPITKWTKLDVTKALRSAGVDMSNASVEDEGSRGDLAVPMGKEEVHTEVPPDEHDGRSNGSILYKLKDIACTWTTSFILLSRHCHNPSTGISEQLDDILLSFGSNDFGELGIGIDSEISNVLDGASNLGKIWVVQFPQSAGVRGGNASRLSIERLQGSQRNVVCVGRYILSGPTGLGSSDSNSRPGLKDEPSMVREVLFAWGASRHGQLSSQTFRRLAPEHIHSGEDQRDVAGRSKETGGKIHIAARASHTHRRMADIEDALPSAYSSPASSGNGHPKSSVLKQPPKQGRSQQPVDRRSAIAGPSRQRTALSSNASNGKTDRPPSEKKPLSASNVRTLKTRSTPFPSITVSPSIIILDSLVGQPLMKDVAIGASHLVVLFEDGQVFSFGSDKKGQIPLCRSSTTCLSDLNNDVLVSTDPAWGGVGACWNTTFLNEGHGSGLWACGSGHRGQLGIGTDADQATAGILEEVRLPLAGEISPRAERAARIGKVAFGSEHVLAIVENFVDALSSTSVACPQDAVPGSEGPIGSRDTTQTELFAWGWNEHGNLGLSLAGHKPDIEDRQDPERVDLKTALGFAIAEMMEYANSADSGDPCDRVTSKDGSTRRRHPKALYGMDAIKGKVSVEGVWAGCGTSWVWVQVGDDEVSI